MNSEKNTVAYTNIDINNIAEVFIKNGSKLNFGASKETPTAESTSDVVCNYLIRL